MHQPTIGTFERDAAELEKVHARIKTQGKGKPEQEVAAKWCIQQEMGINP
jgi:hypothetical protein